MPVPRSSHLTPKSPFDVTLFQPTLITMKRATTFRLHQDVQAGLDLISQLQHRPKNKLVNEAVAEYVTRHAVQADEALKDVLKNLKSYQKADPDFAHAIDSCVDAEASYGKHEDPAEGQPTPSASPVTERLRQLINA